MINFQKINQPIFIVGDILNLSVVFYISLYFADYFADFNESSYQYWEFYILLPIIILWLIIGHSFKLYRDWSQKHVFKLRLINYLKTYAILSAILISVYFIFSFPQESNYLFISLLFGIPSLGLVTNLVVVKSIKPLQALYIPQKTALIVGEGPIAKRVEEHVKNRYPVYAIRGFIACENDPTNQKIRQDKIVSHINELKDYLSNNPVDEIFLAVSPNSINIIQSVVKIADYHGTRVKFVPDFESLFGETFTSRKKNNIEFVNVRQLPLDSRLQNFLKSSFDKIFAFTALIFLAVPFIIISILIKMESPGPIFYCPQRIGKGGKPFNVFKFRTMSQNDAVVGGAQSTVKDDPRITKFGKFLRKYSLDEVPQFLNVLIGEMSVVGPRPHRTFLNQMLQASEEGYMVRHYYKPGITGWAQINGWRGPLETCEQKRERTRHDLWYLNNWKFWLDLKIIWLTIFGSKTNKNVF